VDILESLRGLMAVWVVVGHVCLAFAVPSLDTHFLYQLIGDNARAVDVFMVLSGFVIFELLRSKQEPYTRYVYRRFMRIYPAFLVVLLISAAMLPLSLEGTEALTPNTERDHYRSEVMVSTLDALGPHMLAHLSLLHGLVPDRVLAHSDFAIFAQAWSLSLEWQFYLLAPLAFSLVNRVRPLWGYAIVQAASFVFYKLRWWFNNDGFIGSHIRYFLLGMICSQFWNSPASKRLMSKRADAWILLAVAACIVSLHYWQLAFWFAVFGSALAMREDPVRQGLARWIHDLLATRSLRWLGRVSYSVYLVHMVPFFATTWILRNAGLPPSQMLGISLLITIPTTLLLAEVMYRWVEAPMIRFGKRPLFGARVSAEANR
jgi:peptidoglycan/LPS O-acetylase OafA/YrhL